MNESLDSIRNTFRHLYRMTALADWTSWINVVCENTAALAAKGK